MTTRAALKLFGEILEDHTEEEIQGIVEDSSNEELTSEIVSNVIKIYEETESFITPMYEDLIDYEEFAKQIIELVVNNLQLYYNEV